MSKFDFNAYNISLLVAILFLIVIYILQYMLLIKRKRLDNENLLNTAKNFISPFAIINLNRDIVVFSTDSVKKIFDKNYITTDELFKNQKVYNLFKNKQLENDKNNISTKHYDVLSINNKIFKIEYNNLKYAKNSYMLVVIEDITTNIECIKEKCLKDNVLNAIPSGVIILKIDKNKDTPIITYINEEVEKISGYNKKQLIEKPLNVLFDLRIEDEKYEKLLDNIYKLKNTTLSYKYNIVNKDEIFIESNIIPIKHMSTSSVIKNIFPECITALKRTGDDEFLDTDIFVFMHQKNVSDFKKQEVAINNYVNVLKKTISGATQEQFTIIDCLNGFLEANTKRDTINSALKAIGTFNLADRAYIFRVEPATEDKSDYTMFYEYEWVNNSISTELNNPLLTNNTFSDVGGLDILNDLKQNKISKILVNKLGLNLAAKHTLSMQGIKALIAAPIFKNDELIAWIGLDDCSDDNREWSEVTEQSLLEAAKRLPFLLEDD